MKLTRLRLLGFKSFVEPTDFLIEPGLTGVVGPNGCGKSNLVEALRWVMGESSYKSMRASSMDDVIFSGNTSRPARNNAEVGIAIDNSDRSAPAAFNDQEAIDIARRIERESGSTYRINGREVRARDVQILFADASTGARSPALVHQGRIGEIIQAKPEQRRRVLEEAAGVAGLHARRHEAELRLKAAESNLLRLEDVIGQLASQMEGLKKQARQAVRYRTVSAQVRKNEATLYHLRWSAAGIEVTDAEQAKDVCQRTVAERTGEQAEASKRQAMAQAALPELRDAEARAGAALNRINAAMAELEREEQRARDRLTELEMRITQFAADREREQKLAADAQEALARIAEEEEAIRRDAHDNASRRSGVEAKVAEANGGVDAAEKIFSDLTAKHADLTARRNQLESAVRQHTERAGKLNVELAEIERELATLQASDGPDLAALTAAVDAAQAAIAAADTAAVDAEVAHTVARQKLEAARGPLSDTERKVQRLETEARTLSKVLAVETKNMWPPVMDNITVEKGYEKALGAALGDDLDAPIDPSAPMRWMGSAVDATDPKLSEGIEPLSAYVEAPAELARRLQQIGVVDRDTGNRLSGSLKPGQRLVSRDGDLWRWDGFAAAAHAPTGAARRLAERARLADIEAELQIARAEAEAARGVVEAAQSTLEAASQAETDARNAARERQREAYAARDAHDVAEREVNRNAARVSALSEARVRLTANRDEATAAKAEAERLPRGAGARRRSRSRNGRRARRHRRQAQQARRSARRAAGDRARSGACRPPAGDARQRPRRLAAAPGRRDHPDRHAGAAQRRGRTRPRRVAERARTVRAKAQRADQRSRAGRGRAPCLRRPPAGSRERAWPRPTATPAPRWKRRARRARNWRAPRNASKPPSAALRTSSTRSARCWKSSPQPSPSWPR